MLKISARVEIPAHEIQWNMVRAQGPGGQHVNKTSTAVQLFFDVKASSLPPYYKERILQRNDQRITEAGKVVIKVQETRSLEMNRELALERLRDLILEATKVQKKRRPTRPTRNSQKRRIDKKKQQGEKKAMRRKLD
ncbi:alternative ribosome rescue aminoacyl-tRNA hydrolase ArfB [Cerasicoccus frondis]|uniref:alternative ribosome rescue aminoacyl-tRNA hydrolase ArfB n=1 Tax=Cerasicoccus frondis TaxID=490090 RepID=UPI002852655F|nr:alternative ribosome rescue aminoacyl-tRNA hydrolase ArfB [Cerasicoccus frondis]